MVSPGRPACERRALSPAQTGSHSSGRHAPASLVHRPSRAAAASLRRAVAPDVASPPLSRSPRPRVHVRRGQGALTSRARRSASPGRRPGSSTGDRRCGPVDGPGRVPGGGGLRRAAAAAAGCRRSCRTSSLISVKPGGGQSSTITATRPPRRARPAGRNRNRRSAARWSVVRSGGSWAAASAGAGRPAGPSGSDSGCPARDSTAAVRAR